MRCRYCSAPLMAMGTPDPRRSHPCHRCHASVAEGQNFCSSCGAPAVPGEAAGSDIACPGCGQQMERHSIAGGHPVDACPQCGGAWIPQATLDAVIEAARERPLPRDAPPRKQVRTSMGDVVYRRCPHCSKLMARRNFARISGIILDNCPQHGTYFDYGELPAVVEFVRQGGLEHAQRKEVESLKREAARARDQVSASQGGMAGMNPYGDGSLTHRSRTATGIDLVAAFVGWVVWWER